MAVDDFETLPYGGNEMELAIARLVNSSET